MGVTETGELEGLSGDNNQTCKDSCDIYATKLTVQMNRKIGQS